MKNYEDIERMLVAKGYEKHGEYNRSYTKKYGDLVGIGITEHELSFGMRYSIRARFLNDQDGPEWGKQVEFKNIELETFYKLFTERPAGEQGNFENDIIALLMRM